MDGFFYACYQQANKCLSPTQELYNAMRSEREKDLKKPPPSQSQSCRVKDARLVKRGTELCHWRSVSN